MADDDKYVNGRGDQMSLEDLMAETYSRVSELHEKKAMVDQIPGMKVLLEGLVATQGVMAASAVSMADTFKRAEDRQARLETLLAGKDQIPLKSHYWTILGLIVPIAVMGLGVILYTLHFTNQELNASLTELKMGQSRTQDIVRQSTQVLKDDVSEVKENVKDVGKAGKGAK